MGGAEAAPPPPALRFHPDPDRCQFRTTSRTPEEKDQLWSAWMDRPEAPLEMREDLYRAYGIPARLVCVPSKAARFASVSRYVSRSRGAQDRLALTEGFWSEEDALRDEFQQYEEGDPDDPLPGYTSAEESSEEEDIDEVQDSHDERATRYIARITLTYEYVRGVLPPHLLSPLYFFCLPAHGPHPHSITVVKTQRSWFQM